MSRMNQQDELAKQRKRGQSKVRGSSMLGRVARDEAEVADCHDGQQDDEKDADAQEVAVATRVEWYVACPVLGGRVEGFKGIDAHG